MYHARIKDSELCCCSMCSTHLSLSAMCSKQEITSQTSSYHSRTSNNHNRCECKQKKLIVVQKSLQEYLGRVPFWMVTFCVECCICGCWLSIVAPFSSPEEAFTTLKWTGNGEATPLLWIAAGGCGCVSGIKTRNGISALAGTEGCPPLCTSFL